MKNILINLKRGTEKLQITRFVVTVFLLFVAFFTESYGVSQTFFVVAYFMTVFETLYKSFISISKKNFFNDDIIFLLVSLFALVLGIEHASLIVNMYYYSIYIEKVLIRRKQEVFTLSSDQNIEHVNIVNELGAISVTTPEHIKKGDVIVVNPGEYILTDGIVIDGFSNVNTETVTHDTLPREVSINDRVLAGYINLTSPITYKSRCDIYSTHIETEKKLAEKSISYSSKAYGFVRRYCKLSSLLLLFVSLILLLVSVFSDFDFESVVALLIASGMITLKTALHYVISDSVYTGIKNGILFKKADSIIDMPSVSTAIFEFKNKIGDFVVESAEIYDEYSEDNLKDIAASLYSKSTLPYSEAVCRYTGLIDASSRLSGFREIDHSGCFAFLDGHQIVSGTTEFMHKSKIHIPFVPGPDFAGIHFAVDGTYIGNIRFAFNDFYKLFKVIADMRCCGIKHFVIFGTEDEFGAKRIRNTLKSDYFSITADRTKIINDIIDNVNGKIVLFGWHDWLVSGVESVYIGSGSVDIDYTDADIIISGKSVLHTAVVTKLSSLTKRISKIAFFGMLVFKLIVLLMAITGSASVYFTIIAEFFVFIGISMLSVFKFKKVS